MTCRLSPRQLVFWVFLLAVQLAGQRVVASDLKFDFNLPSFGGNSNSTNYYLNMLEQQKPDFPTASGETKSDAQLFEEQLQRRIISAVSAQVVSSIYGGSFTVGDTFTIGDFSVLYVDPIESGNVCIEINDGISTTQVCVPAP